MPGDDKRYSLEPEQETTTRSMSKLSIIVVGVVILGLTGVGFALYFNNFSVSIIGAGPEESSVASDEALPQTVSEIAEAEGFFDPERIEFAKPADEDGDQLIDDVEVWFGTKTNSKDSDGDGKSDYQEVDSCTNPNGDGDITKDQFVSYCAAFLTEYEFEYEQGLEVPCEVWWPLTQRVIEADRRGDDPREVISTYDAAFNALCDQSAEFASDEIDLDSVCYILSSASFNVCDVEKLNLYYEL